MKKNKKIYDVIIVGGGPAGMTAALYCARYKLKTLLISKFLGGVVTEAHKICNFPTYKEISGLELTKRMIEQVKDYDIEIKQEEVAGIEKKGNNFIIKTKKEKYKGKKIIIAIGREKRKAGIKGEEKFIGKGVSYCATCDAPFFKNKIVAVVGGSNSALTSSLLLSKYAKKVYIIYRRDKFFRAEPFLIEEVKKNKKIKAMFNSLIKEICGKDKVEKIILNNGKGVKVDGVFIETGLEPNRRIINMLNLKNENGYIVVDKEQKTSCDGIYAAGDVTNNVLKQIITACAEGAIAAYSVYRSLKNK